MPLGACFAGLGAGCHIVAGVAEVLAAAEAGAAPVFRDRERFWVVRGARNAVVTATRPELHDRE
jgi:hypothetical protein